MWRCFGICLLGSSVFFLACCRDDPESSAAKHEWSVLESVAAKQTSPKDGGIQTQEEDGYHFIGLESEGHLVWVMLNPQISPFYKQTPRGNYKLSPQQFRQIKDTGTASATVVECLSSHVSE